MALSVADLAVELGIIAEATEAIEAGQLQVVTRLHAMAETLIEDRASPAPAAIKDLAIVSIAAYQYDRPSATPGAGYSNIWENSGAGSMLARWVQRRAVAIGGEGTAAAGTATGTGLTTRDVQDIARDLLRTHADESDAHHEPPVLDAAEAIQTHAADDSAHHPDVVALIQAHAGERDAHNLAT